MKKYTHPVDMASLFDGKVCTKCSEWKPYSGFAVNRALSDGYASFCRMCRSEIHQRRKQTNLEAIRESSRKWMARAREDPNYVARLRKGCMNWEKQNQEYRNKYKSERYHRRMQDPVIAEKRREKAKRDAEAKELRRLQRGNPRIRELEIACVKRREERIKANGVTYTQAQRKRLFAQYGNKCLRCGRDDVPLTADHVIPVLQGGSNLISNIQPLCRSCNSIKGTKSTDYR